MNEMVLVNADAFVVAIVLLVVLLLVVVLTYAWLLDDTRAAQKGPDPRDAREALQRDMRHLERDEQRAARQTAQRYVRDADALLTRRKSS